MRSPAGQTEGLCKKLIHLFVNSDVFILHKISRKLLRAETDTKKKIKNPVFDVKNKYNAKKKELYDKLKIFSWIKNVIVFLYFSIFNFSATFEKYEH